MWGDPAVPDTLDGARERKGWGVTRGVPYNKQWRETRERATWIRRTPDRIIRTPLVRYIGIKAKQPLFDVTHEAASAHPGVPATHVRARLPCTLGHEEPTTLGPHVDARGVPHGTIVIHFGFFPGCTHEADQQRWRGIS